MTSDAPPPTRAEDHQNELDFPFPVRKLVAAIFSQRKVFYIALCIGFLLSLIAGAIRPKKYTANVLLMPPEASTLSTTSTLTALNANPLSGGLGGGAGILNSRTPGGTVIGVLGSHNVQDSIIDRFHLIDLFHSKYRQDARDRLVALTAMAEDKKSGLLSVNVTSTDPVLARDLANAYVSELDGALHAINTSSAHRERVFLEERLKSLKLEIDDLAMQLSKFATRTGTLNPQAQGQALFETAAKIDRELGVAQADLSGLRTTYADENVRVRAAKARVNSLGAQLAALGNSNTGTDDETYKNQILPNIRQLPNLGVTYSSLNQQLTSEQGVYATLTRQYELARVEEAKEVPAARVLDKATIPDRPSSISLMLLTLLGTALSGLAALGAVAAKAFWSLSSGSDPDPRLESLPGTRWA